MATIRWNEGYKCEFKVFSVNQHNWENQNELDSVVSASIHRNSSGDYPLLESGDMQFAADLGAEFKAGWYRIVAYVEQNGFQLVHPLATLYFQRASLKYHANYIEWDASGESVLVPLEYRTMTAGEYVPKNSSVSDWIAEKIRSATPAPVVVKNSFKLSDPLVFAAGTTYLQAIWTALDTKGYVLQIDGNGVINICAKPTLAALTLDKSTMHLIVDSEINGEMDLSGVPNRYYAVDALTGTVYVATNADPQSDTSYQAKGNVWVDKFDDSPKLLSGESTRLYVKRRLEEESTVYQQVTLEREYYPGITLYDLIVGELPDQGLDGDFRVASQELNLGNGIKVTETLSKEIKEYVAL